MLRKVIVVYNPRSSKFQAVEREILTPLRRTKGWLVGKYVVKPTGVDENAAALAKILYDGDLVIAAGGDGTAVIAVNGIMLAEKDVALGVFGYGNFNDVARMMKSKRPVEYGGEYIGGVEKVMDSYDAGKVMKIYPLDVEVDGEHWRYVPCYLTLGLFAESVAVFDDKKVRQHLQKGGRSRIFSIWNLAKWYFQNRRREFLPQGKLQQNEPQRPGIMIQQETDIMPKTTDYLAINGPRVASMMRGNKCYLEKKTFRSGVAELGGLGGLIWFMLRSIAFRIPGRKTTGDVIRFAEPSTVEIHAEGEYQKLINVKKIRVKKAGKALKVINFSAK